MPCSAASAGGAEATAASLAIRVERTSPGAALTARLHDARSAIFARPPTRALRRLVSAGPATLAEPSSQMCTAAQFDEPKYDAWVRRLGLDRRHLHRKQWEFVYILQVLERHGMIAPGRRGLGFGIGVERLPALMAAAGCTIVATDLPPEGEIAAAWSAAHQHGSGLDSLRAPDICDDATLEQRVTFRPVDMNHVPDDLTGFDFTWSSCAFEHLGSIPAGLRFVERSLDCLRPGGIAVHTTELNLTSNHETVDRGLTVLFRKRDMDVLALRLDAAGHEVLPLKYDAGHGHADDHIDLPPFAGDAVLKVLLGRHMTTSFGIAVRKGTGRSSRRRWFERLRLTTRPRP